MYWMLKSKRFKVKRNQMLHLMDNRGKTFCQTENVKRKGKCEFIGVDEPDGRPICKMCLIGHGQLAFPEPDLGVLMGEKMAG